MTQKVAKRTLSSNQLLLRFTNVRGEAVNKQLSLLNDPERASIWRKWALRHFPRDIFAEFRLIDAEGSGDWLNVVEHSVFVAAGSLTLANLIRQSGRKIHTNYVVRGAMVHDATKRIDVEEAKSRDAEPHDLLLAEALVKQGYHYIEMVAALNTGRLADRFITDSQLRRSFIAAKPLEVTIVGYVDARTRGSRIYSLEEARDRNLASKKDETFFKKYWYPYYKDAEAFLREVAPDFDPAKLTDDAIYHTILKATKDLHRI